MILALALLPACGGTSPSPTQPTPTPPVGGGTELRAGPYILIINGLSSVAAGCTLSSPDAVVSVITAVDVRAEGGGWVVRSDGVGQGNLVMRLRASGSVAGATGITGTASGTAAHLGFTLGTVAATRIVFDGEVEVQGALSPVTRDLVAGEIRGGRFEDAASVVATCSRVGFTLGPRSF